MRIVIIGAGALGRVVAEIIARTGEDELAGFVDDSSSLADEVNGVPVLGDSGTLAALAARGSADAAVVALGQGPLRLVKGQVALAAGLKLPVICDSSAIVSPTAFIEEGAIISPLVVIGPGARIGRLAIIGSGSVIEHDALVEEGCYVGPRCLVDARAHLAAGARLTGGAVIAQDCCWH